LADCADDDCSADPSCNSNSCVASGGSCASGQTCCAGLDCCSGMPFAPGQETCYAVCPISDRNAKTGFEAVDPQAVLDKVVSLPITTWRYLTESDAVRHIGPMAQDFRSTFG